ncbi:MULTISPECIES: GNAT family N-acetyltransferase [unclassified Streptomyces]|uniref:GNAT family N-acetyltransferase n=1 Tax=unclassified Streptomyces TaxID=2593676 RepID=UPI0036871185
MPDKFRSRHGTALCGVIEWGMASFWTGSRVRLRGIEPDDWRACMRFAAEQERLGDVLYPPRSAEGYRAWAREQAAADHGRDCFQLAVEAADSGEIVGTVGTYHADARAGWFEYGVMIGADQRHKGYASEAVVMLLRFMFAERRYHKCQARVFAYNEGSLALHRRLGFVEEGRLREHVFLVGRYHDLVLMGMLAEEFSQLHPVGGL